MVENRPADVALGAPKFDLKTPMPLAGRTIVLLWGLTSVIMGLVTMYLLMRGEIRLLVLLSLGMLAVAWRVLRGNRVQLVWEERGVDAPGFAGQGFGMQLIENGVRHSLGGKTKIEFRKPGLYVELELPLGSETQTKGKQADVPVPA